jgi:hypothetical protein
MNKLIDFGKFIILNWHVIMQGLLGLCTALAAAFSAMAGLALLIPGDQPEKTFVALGNWFHGIADWLAKFSKKPADDPTEAIQPTVVVNAPVESAPSNPTNPPAAH